jgi:hypothetical protein
VLETNSSSKTELGNKTLEFLERFLERFLTTFLVRLVVTMETKVEPYKPNPQTYISAGVSSWFGPYTKVKLES